MELYAQMELIKEKRKKANMPDKIAADVRLPFLERSKKYLDKNPNNAKTINVPENPKSSIRKRKAV